MMQPQNELALYEYCIELIFKIFKLSSLFTINQSKKRAAGSCTLNLTYKAFTWMSSDIPLDALYQRSLSASPCKWCLLVYREEIQAPTASSQNAYISHCRNVVSRNYCNKPYICTFDIVAHIIPRWYKRCSSHFHNSVYQTMYQLQKKISSQLI